MLLLSCISTSAGVGRPLKAAVIAAVLAMLLSCITIPAAAGMISPSPNMPPEGGVYEAQDWIMYAPGVFLRGVTLSQFTASYPPPPPGYVDTHTFGAQLDGEMSLDAGLNWRPISAPATETVQTVGRLDGTFGEEMTSLSANVGEQYSPIYLRESPILASQGETTITPVGGNYQIDSFFDVFTELSLDGGMTWYPSTESTRMELTPEPSSFIALFAGLLGLAGIRRRRT